MLGLKGQVAELSCVCYSKAGITEVFEGHHGPVTGLSCHSAGGPVDFSHLFISSSFDWTVKLWSTKVRLNQSLLESRLEQFPDINLLFLSATSTHAFPCRVPVHYTLLRTAVTTSTMRCGLQHTLPCLLVWT